MSVNPLPVPNPASTASPLAFDSPTPVPRTGPRPGDRAFGTQLQDARRQQSDAADAQSKRDGAQSAGRTPLAATTSKAAMSDSSKTNLPSPLGSLDKPAEPTAGSAASNVLGLIGQSSESPNSATGAAAKVGADAKAGQDKTQPDNATSSPPTPSPTGTAAVPPLALSGPGSAQSTDSAAVASTSSQAAVGGSGVLNSMFAKSSGSLAATDESDAADSSETTSDGGDVVAATSFVLNTELPDQVDSSQLFGVDRAALGSLDPNSAETGSQAQNSGDTAVLGLAVNTSLPALPAAGAALPHSLNLNAPVNSPSFAQELGQQVTWLSGQAVKQAQIRLNPEELGQIDVKLTVEHGRVDVAFMAQHPAAVVAVQHSLDQLNQMLGGHGLSLGQTSVGQQAMQQQPGSSQGQLSTGSAGAEQDTGEPSAATSVSTVSVGLVDTFA